MAKKTWEEVSILVDQEFAEAISGALSEIIPGGIVQERVFSGQFPDDLDQELGPVRVYGYIPIDSQLDQRREKIKEAIYYLGTISPLPEPSFSFIEEQDWTSAWQDRYVPIPLGAQLIVVPSWLENPAPDRITISMDPEMAFGSGTHPTTQLSLILLEEVLSNTPIEEMIDIGCGSGILSIAAAKLGVNHVVGVDIDPDSIRISQANAKMNQVDDRISFFLGSIGEVLKESSKISQATLVAANIIAPILTRLFEEGLSEILAPEGYLILSGILEEQLPNFSRTIDIHGLDIQSQRQQGEWVALLAARKTE